MCIYSIFFFSLYGDHRDLHVLTHSFPTRRSSDLLSTGLTAVIPSAKQTAELADEPRPWQRIFLSLAKRTMSSTVRKKASYPSSAISASSSSICFTTCAGAPSGQRLRDRKSTRLNSSH